MTPTPTREALAAAHARRAGLTVPRCGPGRDYWLDKADETLRVWADATPPPPPTLTLMRTADVMARWTPASHPQPWTWDDEARDLALRPGCCWSAICTLVDEVTGANHRHVPPGAYQDGVVARIERDGIGFLDDAAPILAGHDGRIWDGHHRLVAARALGIEWVHVEIVTPEGQHTG